MSPPASSPAGWRTGPPGSCRPRCPGPRSGGSCRSPSRSSGRSLTARPAGLGDRHRPGRQDPADRRRTARERGHVPRARRRCGRRCGGCGGPAGRTPAKPGAARTAASPPPGSPGSTPAWRMSAPTRCTRPPPTSPRRYETVVAEDLNVAGMPATAGSPAPSPTRGSGRPGGCSATRRPGTAGRLSWPTGGIPVHQDLLGLRAVKAKLALSERTFTCDRCGLVLDRDVNAARNLLSLAASGAESQNACGGCARPGPAGHGGQRTRNPAPRTRARPGPPGRKTRLPATHPPQ